MSSLLDFVLSQDQFRRARLSSLYSDFGTQRKSNPDGFAANVAAWTDVLCKATRAGVLPTSDGLGHENFSILVGRPLLRSLETKEWGQPLALQTVIVKPPSAEACFETDFWTQDEAQASGKLIPYDTFLALSAKAHGPTWKSQPWSLLSWGLKQFGIDGKTAFGLSHSTDTILNQKLVILDNVEEAANLVSTHLPETSSLTDRIYSMSMFKQRAAAVLSLSRGLTESDLDILLVYLARYKGAITYDAEVVKFRRGEESLTLSSQDKNIASLKALISDLNNQVEMLSARVRDSTLKAQAAISSRNRTLALSALKSKKMVENTLKQRLDTQLQLEEVYHKIEQAADQVTAVKAMQSSTEVLRNLRSELGGIERVEDVLEELREEMDKVDEVSRTIEAGGQSNIEIDEDAVDEELQQMILQDKERVEEHDAQQTAERLAAIPELKSDLGSPQRAAASKETSVEAETSAMMSLSLDEDTLRTG